MGDSASPRRDSAAKRVSLFGMLTALALVLSWIERLFPPIAGAVPGVKLGLANVVVLLMLYHRGLKQAFAVSLLRVLVTGLVFTNLQTMLYSLAGGLLSLGAMALAKRLSKLSIAGVSVVGAVFHNLGQIGMAALVLKSPMLITYVPVLLAAGVGTGLATGVAAAGVLRTLRARG